MSESAEILCIGTEILLGNIVNTNSQVQMCIRDSTAISWVMMTIVTLSFRLMLCSSSRMFLVVRESSAEVGSSQSSRCV